MVVSTFGRGDVDVVASSLRHFSSLPQRSLGGLPAMQFRRPCTLPLRRKSFLLFLFGLFVLLHDLGLSPERLGQRFHLIGHKIVSRVRRRAFCGHCLLADCFGHLHKSSIAGLRVVPGSNGTHSSLIRERSTVRSHPVASNANLTLNALNAERRLSAPIGADRTTATPPKFPSRDLGARLFMHPSLDQSLATGAGGLRFITNKHCPG